MKTTILLVEDDSIVSAALKVKLEKKGHIVLQAYNGGAVQKMVIRHSPDCIVLDIGLPNISGYEVCQDLKKYYKGPIIFLTGNNTNEAEIAALQLGADDFINKERKFDIFYYRISRLLKNNSVEKVSVHEIRFGTFIFNNRTHQCSFNNQRIVLSKDESELLYYLLINKSSVISRDDLYLSLKGYQYDGISRGMDLNISRLKEKLTLGGVCKDLICSIRGKGYILYHDKFTDALKSEEAE